MQRDIVLRWIEQIARLVARLLRGGAAADLAAARDQVEEATAGLLGPLAELMPRLEAGSAAELLGDPDRIFGYAQLLDLDATIAAALGLPGAGRDQRERAVAFAREALRRRPEPTPEWESWIAARTQADAGEPSTGAG